VCQLSELFCRLQRGKSVAGGVFGAHPPRMVVHLCIAPRCWAGAGRPGKRQTPTASKYVQKSSHAIQKQLPPWRRPTLLSFTWRAVAILNISGQEQAWHR
jgi:hypothetical protein